MTTREITGTIVGVRALREDATRLFGALLGTSVSGTLHVRCAGASLPPLDQLVDVGNLRQKRIMSVRDLRLNGEPAWLVRTDGAEAEIISSATVKAGDAVTLAVDLDAQPRTIPVGR